MADNLKEILQKLKICDPMPDTEVEEVNTEGDVKRVTESISRVSAYKNINNFAHICQVGDSALFGSHLRFFFSFDHYESSFF